MYKLILFFTAPTTLTFLDEDIYDPFLTEDSCFIMLSSARYVGNHYADFDEEAELCSNK